MTIHDHPLLAALPKSIKFGGEVLTYKILIDRPLYLCIGGRHGYVKGTGGFRVKRVS